MEAAQGQQGDDTHLNSRPAGRTDEAMRWSRVDSEKAQQRLGLETNQTVLFVDDFTTRRSGMASDEAGTAGQGGGIEMGRLKDAR